MLSDWSLYTMGVHGVRVVSASLFNCASLRSSKNRGNYPKAFFSKKKRSSLQNGCAYSLSLYIIQVRAPGGPYFHISWFAFKKGQPLVTLIVTFDCVLWSATVFRHCSALFSGLKSLLHNGCSWCICCFCIVISYCSIKFIENKKNYISEDTG